MLLLKTAVALALGVALIAFCYFFVDRPVAWFVHQHSLASGKVLRWLAHLSDRLKDLAPAAIVVVVLWRLWKRAGRFQTVLLAIAANLVVTTVLKQLLKWGCGRYWPMPWREGNPSLIGSGDYGFHPFHAGWRMSLSPRAMRR